MDPRVERLKTAQECQAFAANARARGREDLALEARRRAIELRAESHHANSPVEAQCFAAMCAHAEMLEAKGASTAGAWQMVRRLGVLQAVDRIVSRADGESVYAALVEMGLEAFALEAVVVRHPEEFSFEAVQHSRRRMARRATP
jgi:hypothetical protein